MSLTLYFIVEPPEYQTLACYLAASIRQQFGAGVALVALVATLAAFLARRD